MSKWKMPPPPFALAGYLLVVAAAGWVIVARRWPPELMTVFLVPIFVAVAAYPGRAYLLMIALLATATLVVDRYVGSDWAANVRMVSMLTATSLVMGEVIHRSLRARRQAEAALRRSEERFAKAFRASPSALVISRQADGRILEVNDSWATVTGYARDEVLARSSLALGLLDAEARERAVAQLRARGFLRDFEVDIRRKSGEVRHARLSGEAIEIGGEPCLLTLIDDVTERRRAEAAEREQRELAEALRETAAALSSTLDFDEVLDRILASAGRVVPHDASSIALIESGAARLVRGGGRYRQAPDDAVLTLHLPLAEFANLREMAESGQPVLIPDTAAEPGWVRVPEAAWVRSCLGAPIRVHGQVLGFLYLDSATPGHFTPAHCAPLQAFADQAAIALRNARLLEEAQRRADQFAALYEMSHDLATQTDLPGLLETIVGRARRLFKAPVGGITLYDRRRGDFVKAVVQGSEGLRGMRVAPTEGATGRVAQTRQPVIIEDYQTWPGHLEGLAPLGFRAMVHVPMLYGGELIGVLNVTETGESTRRFTDRDARLLSLFASQAAGAVHSARLLEEARDHAEHLRQSEADYRTLFENVPDGVYRTTPDGRLLAANPALVRILGYASEAELQTADIARDVYLDPAERTRWQQMLEAEGEARNVELALRRKDGRAITVLDSTRVVRDADGAVLYYEGVLSDITERRQRERELEAVASVSAAMRSARSRAEMLPVILDRMMDLLQAGGAAVALRDGSGGTVIEVARGGWREWTGIRLAPGEGVSGHVIATGQAVVSADVQADARMTHLDLLYGLRAVACLPLVAREQTIGALWVGRETGITDSDVRVLAAVADIAANALHRAALHEETERRAEELTSLGAIGRRLTESLNLTAVLDGLLEETGRIVPGHALAIMLYDPARDDLWIEAARGYPTDAWRTFRVRRGEGVTGRVAARLEPALVRQVANTPEWLPMEGMPPSGSEIAVPLVFRGRLVGVINAESPEAEAFDENHLRLLAAVADYAAVAVENARLFAETGRRLQRLEALHAIDAAISGSLDLRVSLAVLLDQVTRQLGVDAADVLLLGPNAQTLEFAAGRGFRAARIERTRLRLGEGLAGQAALERRVVRLEDPGEAGGDFLRSRPLAGEAFVAYHGVPLVAKGQVRGVLEVFHRTRLEPGAEWLEFLVMLATQAAVAIDNAALFEGLQRSNVELAVAYDAIIAGWGRALELRDAETEGHTQRVTELAVALAQAMGVAEAELVHLRRGALLHDVGKMGIPDSILLKPGPLTDGERAIMREHPVYAYQMLAPIAHLRPALDIPYCHHEKWDGTGYPRGLAGEAIPLAARIFAVADVWDALRSDRPYRSAWPEAAAREYIRMQAGKHFDPQVAQAFMRSAWDQPRK